MSINTRSKGKDSEETAQKYLENKGYTLIERNFFIAGGEIDLIMQDKEFVVFVEVKSIRLNSQFSIYESLTKRKKKFLRKAINNWLLKKDKITSTWRIDFLGVILDKDKVHKIEHFKFIDLL